MRMRNLLLLIGRGLNNDIRNMIFLTMLFITIAPRIVNCADLQRNAGYFYEQAIASNPTIHDVGERIRIAKGINPDRIAEFTGMHETVSFPGDTEPDADDFKEESYGQLKSEIRMTYAELASARSQIYEVKQSVELLRQIVETSNTLYANGKLDQWQALKAQIEWEQMSGTLLLIEKREMIFTIRLNVLVGFTPDESIAKLETLQEYSPGFDSKRLIESYKFRRFLELFQKMARPDYQPTVGGDSHGADSLEIESKAFISTVRISLESLYERAKRYRTSLIPKAELAHATRLEQYKNGRLDLISLLEGLARLSDLRREYQEMLGEAHILKAKVEYVTGAEIE